MSERKRARIGIGPSLLLAIGLPLYRAWMSTLRIRWPNGETQVFQDLHPNRIIAVVQGGESRYPAR